MHTTYDWIAMGMFAGIVVLFLQRSVGPPVPGDRLIHYLPPAAGCGLGNYCGNHGAVAAAAALLGAALVYIALVLKPFARSE